MANIDKELNQIKNAVYGREVRGSIHDGIKKINTESEDSKQKADEAHDVMESIINDGFDNAALEANFEQKLDDKIANLQPEWTQFKDDTVSQLAQNTDKIIFMNDFIRYGRINIQDYMPEITKKLPFELYRDSDGTIKHTFDIDEETSDVTNDIYISFGEGSDSNDGLTENTPVRFFSTVRDIANNKNWSSFNAIFLDEIIHQDSGPRGDLSNFSKVVLKTKDGKKGYVGKALTSNASEWVLDGGTYRTEITALTGILDIKNRDYRGIPQKLTKVTSKADCENIPNSYYYSSPNLYVHTFDGRKPDSEKDIMPIRDLAGNEFTLGNTKLIIKDLFFVNQRPSINNSLRVSGVEESVLINYNVSTTLGENGIFVFGVGETYSFNSTTSLAGLDGFNYTRNYNLPPVNPPYMFAFEYDCHSYDNGTLETGTNNATTAHSGMSIIRVNSVGYNCYGPVLADVNGCYSLNFDCNMYDSTLPNKVPTKSAYYFDDNGAIKPGKAVLVNCSGGGKDTHSINTDGVTPVTVHKFTGNQIPEGLDVKRVVNQ